MKIIKESTIKKHSYENGVHTSYTEVIEQYHYVRKCTRAYHEYRLELFTAIENALREYSKQWEWIVDNLFKPKCEVFGYCDESKSCGRKPKRQ